MESSVETNRQEEKSGSNSSIVNNVVMQYLESSIIKDDDDPNKNNGNNHATTKQQRDTTTPENGKDAAAAAAAAAAVKEEEEEESLSSPNKRKRRPPTARWDDSTADITPNKNKNTKEEEKDTKPKKNKTDKNKNNEDEEDGTDDMAWICAECKEADYMVQPSLGEEFLICDGNCHRIFHYPCAGLSELPKSDQDWVCKDCSNQQHQCAFCHEYGNDDEDVFLCPKPKCGLFFHESCLAMQNVEVKTTAAAVVQQHSTTHSSSESRNGDNADDEMGAINNSTGATTQDARSNAPVFICPAHNCWTCTQKDAKEVAEKEEKNNAKTLKKKKKKKAQSIFQCKTEHRLFVSSG